MLREVWAYRELFYFLAWRDVKIRYKQTVLGVAWAILQPFFTMIVFSILFGRVANVPTDGIPRPIFYFSALLPWTYFASTLTNGGMSLIANSNLLTKIYFPRVILPAAAALSGLVDFLIATLMLIGIMVYYRIQVSWSLVLWPFLVVVLVILGLGVAMLLAAMNVKYRDIKYAIPFGIQLWLFVTPIIYPSTMIPERFRWILAINPLSGLIEAFRDVIIPSRELDWRLLGLSVVTTVVVFVIGLSYFARTEKTFADVV